MKALFKVLVALVAVLIVGVIALYLARNVIAASVIRSAATSVLGVPVDVKSVDLSLGGTADLEGLTVGNPPSYKAPHVLSAGKVHVGLGGETTTSKIVVDEVTLDNLDVYFVANGTKSNVSQILDGLQSSGDKSQPAGDSVEIVIKRLTLTNLKAHASVSNDVATQQVATISKIELTNISTKGAADDITRQLTARIFEVTVQAIFDEVGKQLPGAIAAGVGQSLQGAGVMIGDTAKAVGEAAGKAADGATKAIGDAAKGVGDLFGGKKDK